MPKGHKVKSSSQVFCPHPDSCIHIDRHLFLIHDDLKGSQCCQDNADRLSRPSGQCSACEAGVHVALLGAWDILELAACVAGRRKNGGGFRVVWISSGDRRSRCLIWAEESLHSKASKGVVSIPSKPKNQSMILFRTVMTHSNISSKTSFDKDLDQQCGEGHRPSFGSGCLVPSLAWFQEHPSPTARTLPWSLTASCTWAMERGLTMAVVSLLQAYSSCQRARSKGGSGLDRAHRLTFYVLLCNCRGGAFT